MTTFTVLLNDKDYALVLGRKSERIFMVLLDDGTIVATSRAMTIAGDSEAKYRTALYEHLSKTLSDEDLAPYYANSIALRKRMLDTKRLCDKCNESKPVAEFYKRSREADGIDNICRGCRIESSATAYKNKQ